MESLKREDTTNIPNDITDIVWDADNTLWDWVTYAVYAYEAMSRCISDETGIPESKVATAMKRFYSDVGTMENPYLVQGLTSMGLFKGIKNFDMDSLINQVQSTFSKVRNQNLHLYDGIAEILAELHKIGIKNHILTDAPGIQAPMRLQHFDLGEFFSSVNIMRAADPKTLPKKFREKQRSGKYDVPFTVRTVDEEKPDSNLEKITHMTRQQIPGRVINIGDNLPKDGGVALKYGNKCLLTGYGFAKEDLLKRLFRFAPIKAAKKNVSVGNTPQMNSLPDNIILVNSTRELETKLKELIGY